jgi:ketosteroid isomerase-like protein
MSARDDFLTWVATRLREAEVALHDGDPGPRLAIWSTNEPVTVLGALRNARGAGEVREAFHWLEGIFSGCTEYSFEIVTAEVIGDMAYTGGFEHVAASVNGEPRVFTLRCTQIYRREDGEWKVAYRHADEVTPRAGASGAAGGLGVEKDLGPRT